MAFQPVMNTIGIEFRGTFQGIAMENTHYGLYSVEPDSAALDTLAEDLWDNWDENFSPIMSTAFLLNEVYIRVLETEIAEQGSYAATPIAGAITGDTLAAFNTLAISRRSGLTGRSSRGRIFWMGLAESQTTNETVNTDVVTDMVAALNSVNDLLVLNGYQPVIVSRYSGGVKRAVGLTFPFNVFIPTNFFIDTRRSRKAG